MKLRLTMAALGAAALCLPAAAVPTQASAAEVGNGAVAFSAKRGGSRVLYTRGPDGLKVVRTLGKAASPSFSPLGKRLAFTRYGADGAQVWTTYLDGTGLRLLTSGPSDGMPVWSPTGQQVAFARGRSGRRDLYRITADGTGLRRLTRAPADDRSPAWSLKDRLAFVRGTGARESVFTMSARGGAARRLTRGRNREISPAWSPTGRTLVVSRGRPGRRDLYVVTANGSRSRRLTSVRGDETEATFSPDGTRIAFTHRRGKARRLYVMKLRGKAIAKLPSRSRRVRRLTSSRSAAATPSWQLTGADPVVAAAADIACDPASPAFNNGVGQPGACRQRMTSDLLMRLDLSSVIVPGDLQYESATLSNFQQSFDLSWGRLKPLIKAVPGNHEYRVPGAAGYFDYLNGPGVASGPAGERGKGYYSYDVGSWHVVGLISACEEVGGCGPGSPQLEWLRADLAANPADCTLVFWHRPQFTSGHHSAGGDVMPFWDLLYGAGADVILNGHEHFYERFAPQNPQGVADPVRGIRQFTVGMGGKSRHGWKVIAPNSEVQDNRTIGILKLTLEEGSYDWELLGAPSARRADSGSGTCH